ncbi:hypothetical protein IFR05_009178 [Cadophora sp. M221]|nr:hypothetical protein IFR05_009178 [Cadophora sp. M221]
MPWFMDALGLATSSPTEVNATAPALSILDLLTLLAWTCLQLTTNKNRIFDIIFSGMASISNLMSTSSLSFWSGLSDAVQSATAPTLAQLKTTPTNFHKRWGVYLLTLEKIGSTPRVYIGSGTGSQQGVSTRLSMITHKGLLLSAPIPSHRDVPIMRALFLLLLEAALCFAFWAVMRKKSGLCYTFGMPRLCSWKAGDIPYTGLCTHTPLAETLGVQFGLSPEDLDALEELRKVRKREVLNKSRAGTRARDKTSGVYYCHDCKQENSNKDNYERHIKLPSHLSKAAGKKPLKSAMKRATNSNNNRKAQKYKCVLCDKIYGHGAVLRRHYISKIHLGKVALSSSGGSF